MDEQSAERLLHRFERERHARIEAESLLEQKAVELFEANKALQKLLTGLDEKVKSRTQELALALEEARKASRVKTDFLAMMSHEIRTPMNAIHGVAQILDSESLPKRQKDLISLVLTASTSLLTIVNDMLDLSKIEAGKLQLELVPFALEQLVGDIHSLYAAKAKLKGLTFKVENGKFDQLLVKGDPGRVRQILINLIDNAIKYTNAGDISLSVSATRLDKDTQSFRFSVTDTGQGIPESKMNRLFQAFDRIDVASTRNIEGAGLGLALCKQLVDLMDGEIGCSSDVGKGSTFWFSVPLKISASGGDVAMADPTTGAPQSGDSKALRILVAEDNVANQIIIKIMLENLGHVVDVVANGQEAVASNAMLPYDLILMDMQMPVLDGIGATLEIRAHETAGTHVKIIALTANAMESDRQKCLKAGMDGFVSKPVTKANLLSALKVSQ